MWNTWLNQKAVKGHNQPVLAYEQVKKKKQPFFIGCQILGNFG